MKSVHHHDWWKVHFKMQSLQQKQYTLANDACLPRMGHKRVPYAPAWVTIPLPRFQEQPPFLLFVSNSRLSEIREEPRFGTPFSLFPSFPEHKPVSRYLKMPWNCSGFRHQLRCGLSYTGLTKSPDKCKLGSLSSRISLSASERCAGTRRTVHTEGFAQGE